MIFLIRPRIAPARAWNHTDKALSGCQRNHVHASSTIAARTRLLPSLPIPCSRSLPPLENGVPPSPTYPPSARRLRNCRTNASRTRSVAKSGPIDRKCRQRTDHPFCFVRRRVLLENGVTHKLHLLNQLQNEIESIEQTFDPRFRLWRNGIAIRLARAIQLLAPIAPQSLISLYAQRRQNAVDLVDDRSPLPAQILPFPIRTPRFLIAFARDRNHRTDPRLAPQPSHQSAQQHLDVDDVGLCPPRPPIHWEARGLDDVNLDVVSRKETRQPKSVAPSLMGQDHPSDLPTCRCAPGLQTLDKRNQPVAASVQDMPRMPVNSRQLNRQNPLLLAQFQRSNDGGVVVNGSLC